MPYKGQKILLSLSDGRYLPATVLEKYYQFGYDWIVHHAVKRTGDGLLKSQYSISEFRTGAAVPMAPQSSINRAIDRGVSVLRAAGIQRVESALKPLRAINPPGKKTGGMWAGYHSGVTKNPRKRKNPSFDYKEAFATLGGSGRLKAMLGAKYMSYDNKTRRIQFRFSGSSKANTFVMTLNDNDLYDIEFYKIRGTSFKKVHEVNDVYASDVRRIFEKYTGLYLSL